MMNRLLQARLLSSPFSSKASFLVPFNNQFPSHGRSSCQVTEILQNQIKVLLNLNSVSGFRSYCTKEDLSLKKCVPCESKDLRAMTEAAANELIPKVPGWNLANEGGTMKLNCSWKVKSFTKGLDLFKVVADLAEAEGHHPDLHLAGWNNVTIEIWTHSVGGLTENDFILASKISALDIKHLLRRTPSN